jgi:hypothetical protein
MSNLFELQPENYIELLRGPVADPAISILLKREDLAVLKVHQLDMEIQKLETAIERTQGHIRMLHTQRDMLIREYGIG